MPGGGSRQRQTQNQTQLISGLDSRTQSGTDSRSSSGSNAEDFNRANSSQVNPWAPSEGLLTDILGQARSVGGNVSNFTPSVSEDTTRSIEMMRAIAGQPMASTAALGTVVDGSQRGYGAGLGALMDTATGRGFENPALDRALGIAGQRTADGVNRQFSAAGRYGSEAHTQALADRLGEIETTARVGAYDRERQNQLAAANQLAGQGFQGAQAATTLDQSRLLPAQIMGQAGSAQDAISNAQREAPMRAAEWQARIGLPLAGVGQTSSGTQSGSSSTASNANATASSSQVGSGRNTSNTQSTTDMTTVRPSDPLAMGLGLGMAGLGAITGNPGMMMGGLGGSGNPLFGMFGNQVYGQPGTAANGGWSTTASRPGWFF